MPARLKYNPFGRGDFKYKKNPYDKSSKSRVSNAPVPQTAYANVDITDLEKELFPDSTNIKTPYYLLSTRTQYSNYSRKATDSITQIEESINGKFKDNLLVKLEERIKKVTQEEELFAKVLCGYLRIPFSGSARDAILKAMNEQSKIDISGGLSLDREKMIPIIYSLIQDEVEKTLTSEQQYKGSKKFKEQQQKSNTKIFDKIRKATEGVTVSKAETDKLIEILENLNGDDAELFASTIDFLKNKRPSELTYKDLKFLFGFDFGRIAEPVVASATVNLFSSINSDIQAEVKLLGQKLKSGEQVLNNPDLRQHIFNNINPFGAGKSPVDVQVATQPIEANLPPLLINLDIKTQSYKTESGKQTYKSNRSLTQSYQIQTLLRGKHHKEYGKEIETMIPDFKMVMATLISAMLINTFQSNAQVSYDALLDRFLKIMAVIAASADTAYNKFIGFDENYEDFARPHFIVINNNYYWYSEMLKASYEPIKNIDKYAQIKSMALQERLTRNFSALYTLNKARMASALRAQGLSPLDISKQLMLGPSGTIGQKEYPFIQNLMATAWKKGISASVNVYLDRKGIEL